VIATPAGDRTTRQHELELRLAKLDRDTGGDSARQSDLRQCLEISGPVFAAFGRYLSSRVDVVPESLCQKFAKISDSGPPSAEEEVRSLFGQEVGFPPERAFAWFDAEPFESRLFWQAHHARLGYQEVTVRIIHPEIGQLSSDGNLLSLLEEPLTASGMTASGFKNALADFQHLLEAAQNFEAELDAARLLAQDAQRFAELGDPGVCMQLSLRHVAVHDRWRSLENLADPAPDLARSLCAVWLQQSLRGSVYPIEPLPGNVGMAPDGRIIFPNGPFATISGALKESLWNYLVAVAAENADDSARYLAAALGSRLTHRGFEQLQRNIRQMVPFRDGFHGIETEEWPFSGQQFAEQLLIHWRIASQNCSMSAELIAFYRGLFGVVQTAQKLAPDRDSLAEAVRDLRLLKAFEQVKDVLEPSRMTALLETYAETFVSMPQRMDRFLTHASMGMTPIPHGRSSGKKIENDEDCYVRTVCLLLSLGAMSMLIHKIAGSLGAGAGPLAAGLFGALGVYVLWVVSR
jgi:predicted unusual protein kinase regulating ubiquinone biosynthesis (AarF/ABC1/UbiB family)